MLVLDDDFLDGIDAAVQKNPTGVISGTPMPRVVCRLAPPRSASTSSTFFLSRARVMPICR